MDYEQRINKVIDFIGQHVDEKLDLDQLSQIACFSKYHFHRLFTAHTGLSLQQYIRWLRLKKAAHQLIVHKEMSIIDIAINAGFESHESFTRVFKQTCGLSPSEFRKKMHSDAWEKPPYFIKKEINMIEVSIQQKPARRLAVLEHRGNPQKVGESVSKLITWAKAQPISVKPKPGDAFGLAYNDPNQVPAEEFHFDLALTVPANLTLSSPVVEKELPAGRYAVAVHKGSRDNIGDTIYAMYRDWLPKSGEELGDLPCLFCYYNFDYEVADTELITECWLLLADS
jgi:AraC family transcriptional regulator